MGSFSFLGELTLTDEYQCMKTNKQTKKIRYTLHVLFMQTWSSLSGWRSELLRWTDPSSSLPTLHTEETFKL